MYDQNKHTEHRNAEHLSSGVSGCLQEDTSVSCGSFLNTASIVYLEILPSIQEKKILKIRTKTIN